MREKEYISSIKQILNSEYIGDDCAYLKDLGIVLTQDSLVEDVHFKRNFITPYQLGYKSIMVNISDIAASGAMPAYLTTNDLCKAGKDLKASGQALTLENYLRAVYRTIEL